MIQRVEIMRGLPGSGKTRYVKTHLGIPATCVVSADAEFMKDGVYTFDASYLPIAHNICLKKYLDALQSNHVRYLLVDNTNIRGYEISPYYRLAEAFGHDVEIIWIVAPVEVCLGRQTHGVPETTMHAMANSFDSVPSWWKQRIITVQ